MPRFRSAPAPKPAAGKARRSPVLMLRYAFSRLERARFVFDAGRFRTASPSLRTRRHAFPICGGPFPEFPRNISRAQAELSAEPGGGCETTVPLNRISASSSLQRPSPPFRGEREGPAKREGEVGGAANRFVGPPHPILSPRPAGGE